MRKYTFVFRGGEVKTFEAEMDSLHPGGAVVLSVKQKISELSEAVEVKIVRVISLHNVEDYGYEDA